MDASCSVPACGKPAKTAGHCASHYHRLRRYGDPLGGFHYRKDRTKPLAPCLAPGCPRLESVRGYCDACYLRLVNSGELKRTTLRRTPERCLVADCDREVYGKGWCSLHWKRARRHGDPNRTPVREESLEQRLRRIAPPSGDDECWVWTGAVDPDDGYGVMGWEGRNLRPHRVAWELANGRRIPSGLVVRHRCDNPPCCNPRHLLIGTQADNIADAVARDRHVYGERSGQAKLTTAQVSAIRAALADGRRMSELARQFGVSKTHIRRIRDGVSRRLG